MKKLLTILALASATTLLHAQGLVYMFGNTKVSTNTAVSTFVGGSQAGGVSGLTAGSASGQVYDYALLYASYGSGSSPALTAAGLANSWTYSGVTATNYTTAGSMFSPGSSGGTAASNWASGATNYVVVVGWSSNLGSSWATVSQELLNNSWTTAGYFGVSTVGYIAAGGGTSPATAVFGGTGVPLGSLTLYAVPEPATMALVAVGGLGLMAIRRRK